MDTSMLDTLALIAPDLMEEMELRALVLERVAALGPIGRRALAARLHLPERAVRAAAQSLCEAGSLIRNASGMEITPDGAELVEAARVISRGRRALASVELLLARRLGVQRVCVVLGDAQRDEGVLEEIGREAARQLRLLLRPAQVLAVSGGREVLAMAQAIGVAAPMDVTVVPAGGGYGNGGLQTQANVLAELLAGKLGGQCRLLHLPDGLPAAAMEALCAMPQVRESLELLAHADVAIESACSAEEAFERRGLNPAEREALVCRGAVGEALGFYFDAQGQVVGGSSPALREEQLGRETQTVLLCAGADYAQAALCVCMHHPHKLMVIDESAALQIVDLLRV